jgi:cell division protein FtsW
MRSEAVMTAPRFRVIRPDDVPPAVARARVERSTRRTLAALSLSVAALTVLGLVMVLSASSVKSYAVNGSSFFYFKRQLLYAAIGAVAAIAASRMRYQAWQRLWAPLMVVTIGLLVLVLPSLMGTVSGGSARWIDVGPIMIQPSELVKFAMVAATASILSVNLAHLDDTLRWAVPIAVLLGMVGLLIMLQPDLGTASIVGLTVFLMLFVAGVRLRTLFWTALASGVLAVGLIWIEGYRRTRLFSFLDPWADPQHTGYQVVQSLIALGSGHLFGVGLGASRQKWLYVPNAHTDFIFSIMGEELGLIGEIVVLALFGVLVFAGIRIAMRAPDPFGRLLAAGITGWLGLQALINLGAVTGLLPITGVPLPFISFGGSSLIVSLFAAGVLWSIGRAIPPRSSSRVRPRASRRERRRA